MNGKEGSVAGKSRISLQREEGVAEGEEKQWKSGEVKE